MTFDEIRKQSVPTGETGLEWMKRRAPEFVDQLKWSATNDLPALAKTIYEYATPPGIVTKLLRDGILPKESVMAPGKTRIGRQPPLNPLKFDSAPLPPPSATELPGYGFRSPNLDMQLIADPLNFLPGVKTMATGVKGAGRLAKAAGREAGKRIDQAVMGEGTGMLSNLLSPARVRNVVDSSPLGKAVRSLETDPNSPQGLLPGVAPLTPMESMLEATAKAQRAQQQQEPTTFVERGVQYSYDPSTRTWRAVALEQADEGFDPRAAHYFGGGFRIDPSTPYQDNTGLAELTRRGRADLLPRMIEKGEAAQDATDRLRGARAGYQSQVARDTEQDIAQRQAQRENFSPTELDERIRHEQGLFDEKRSLPIVVGDRTFRLDPNNHTLMSPRWVEITPNNMEVRVNAANLPPEVAAQLDQHAARLRQQNRITNEQLDLRREHGDFLQSMQPAPPPQPAWVDDLIGPSPRRIGQKAWEQHVNFDPSSESIDAFIKALGKQPEAFKYGTKEDFKGRMGLDHIASIFSQKSGVPITVARVGDSAYDVSYRLETPGGYISVSIPKDKTREITVTSTQAGDAGELLYQVINTFGTKRGQNIDAGSLWPANQLRVLPNAASTAARFGKHPRDVSRAAPNLPKELRAKGVAPISQLLRTEGAEIARRLEAQGVDPDRVSFDGVQFLLDGKPVTAADLKAKIPELSPATVDKTTKSPTEWDRKMWETHGAIGQASLMRKALTEWLDAGITPKQARKAAKNWARIGAPLFASIPPAAVGLGLMGQSEDAEAAPYDKLAKALLRAGKRLDPRFDPRVNEQERLKNLQTVVEPTSKVDIPKVSLPDFEGRGFVMSQADRTATGEDILSINGIPLKRPVHLPGGDQFAYQPENVKKGQAWASAKGPVSSIMKQAKLSKAETGQNPIFLPVRMKPTGSDYAHATGETMLAFLDATVDAGGRKAVNDLVKKFIPDWKGIGTKKGVEQFRAMSDKNRKTLKTQLDKLFRNEGGLNIGEARLAIADATQIHAPDTGLRHVMELFPDRPRIEKSGHPTYPQGVPGAPLGQLREKDLFGFDLLPADAKRLGVTDTSKPAPNAYRGITITPKRGVITAELLRSLGY